MKRTDTDAVWSVAKGDLNGAPLFIRFRQDPRPQLTGSGLEHRVGFAVPLRDPDSQGLPQRHEFEDLSRITTASIREFVFYSSDPEGVRAAIPSLRAQVRTHELQWYIEPDPEWRAYQEFVPAG